MKRGFRVHSIFVASSALGALCAPPALAQTSDAQAEKALAGTDIVVTAQRREQRLQDVGIAVTALSNEQIAKSNITVTQDLIRVVPSLKMASFSSAGTVFNIRGVSQNDFGDQQEPPVAVYADDSYASSITLASFPVYDVARVEVLRGPQGTLFGRNATGGAIQIISNQPTDAWGGYAKIQAGSYGALLLEGALNIPISDSFAARIAGERSTGGNYLKAIVPGVPDVGGQNNYSLRGIFQWKPTSDFMARLTLRYLKADHERQSSLYSHVVSCPNAQGQGEYLAPGATCNFYGLGTEQPGSIFTGYRNDAINPERGGDPWKVAYDYPSYVNRKLFNSTLRLEARLGGVDLVSITDYQHATKFYTEDTDATPDPAANYFAAMKLDQVSQELRFSGKFGNNQWTAGAYGMIINGRYSAAFDLPYLDFFPLVDFKQKTHSYAFFAQDEFALSDQVKLIGGVRYWHDQRRGFFHGVEENSGVDITFSRDGFAYLQNGVPQQFDASTGLTVSPRDADKGYSGLTARAEIDYKPYDGLLLYLSYNRGSKSGGFTFPTATPGPGAVATFFNNMPYRPETLNSYEAGAKVRLGRAATLNIAAFHYDYKNYQAFAQQGVLQTVINLDARVNGAEIELNAQPFPGLTLSANASLLDTVVHNVPLPDGVTTVDRDLPQAPGLSGSALARYEFDLAGGTASVQGDVQYNGKQCFTVLCAPTDREDPYAVANARIGYTVGRYEFAAFVNNIFERKYRQSAIDNAITGGFSLGIYGKPRTFGVSATVHFDDK